MEIEYHFGYCLVNLITCFIVITVFKAVITMIAMSFHKIVIEDISIHKTDDISHISQYIVNIWHSNSHYIQNRRHCFGSLH